MNLKHTLIKLSAVIGTSVMLLTACASDMNSSTYVSSAAVGKVIEGTVITAQPIKIKENAKGTDNMAGILGGGLLGGVGGNAIGGGSGRTAATAGAAVAGAMLGSYIQGKLGTSEGMQYVVRIDPKYVNQNKNTNVTVSRTEITSGKGSMQQQLNESIDMTDTKSDLISVVQGKDVIFQPGQRVLIIYSDDRPRLAPLGY